MVWFGVGGLFFLIGWDVFLISFSEALGIQISDSICKGENPLRRDFSLTL